MEWFKGWGEWLAAIAIALIGGVSSSAYWKGRVDTRIDALEEKVDDHIDDPCVQPQSCAQQMATQVKDMAAQKEFNIIKFSALESNLADGKLRFGRIEEKIDNLPLVLVEVIKELVKK